LCRDLCKQLILRDEYRVYCGVSRWIFDLSLREVEMVQIFLHNKCLQKVIEPVKNAYEKYKITLNEIIVKFDPKKKA
jgi:hypothetical protein